MSNISNQESTGRPSNHVLDRQQRDFVRIANPTLDSINRSTAWENLTPEQKHDTIEGTLDDNVDIGLAPFDNTKAEVIEATEFEDSESTLAEPDSPEATEIRHWLDTAPDHPKPSP